MTSQHKDLTSQHKDLTSQHKDLTRRHKDLTSQHNYLTSDGRSMPPRCQSSVKQRTLQSANGIVKAGYCLIVIMIRDLYTSI